MTYIEALHKLIARNKNFVRKNGPSDYSRETDEIINTLLAYVKETNKVIDVIGILERNRDLCFELFDIDEKFKEIEPEFIERYIKHFVVPQVWISNGNNPQDYQITQKSIMEYYRLAKYRLEKDFQIYQLSKMFADNPETYGVIFPEFKTYLNHGYTDEQVKQELKRKIYYNYE